MTEQRDRSKPAVYPPLRTRSGQRIAALEAPRLPSFDPLPDELEEFPAEEAPTATVSKPILTLLARETLRDEPEDEDSEAEMSDEPAAPQPIAPEPLVVVRTQPPANPHRADQKHATEPPTRPRAPHESEVAPAPPSTHALLWVCLFVLAAALLATLFWVKLG